MVADLLQILVHTTISFQLCKWQTYNKPSIARTSSFVVQYLPFLEVSLCLTFSVTILASNFQFELCSSSVGSAASGFVGHWQLTC